VEGVTLDHEDRGEVDTTAVGGGGLLATASYPQSHCQGDVRVVWRGRGCPLRRRACVYRCRRRVVCWQVDEFKSFAAGMSTEQLRELIAENHGDKAAIQTKLSQWYDSGRVDIGDWQTAAKKKPTKVRVVCGYRAAACGAVS
jgi:hypothetical protein